MAGGPVITKVRQAAAALLGSALLAVWPATASAQAIDPCLVGTWRSNPIDPSTQPAPLTGSTGLGGVVLEFRAEGTELVDYSASEPHIYNAGDAVATYRGKAEAQVTAQGGRATLIAVTHSTVTEQTEFKLSGQTVTEDVQLGPAFLGVTGSSDTYECSAGSLRFGTLPVVWSFSGASAPTSTPGGSPVPGTQESPVVGAQESPVGGTEDGGGAWDTIGIGTGVVIGLVVVGFLIWFFLIRTRERPVPEEPGGVAEPGGEVERPEPIHVSEEAPCGCTGYLLLGGRDTLRVCECVELTWGLSGHEWGGRNVFVTGLFDEGKGTWAEDIFCRRRYTIERAIAECTGGASVDEDSLLDPQSVSWELARGGPDQLILRCKANVWVRCPGKEPQAQEFAGEFMIKLLKVKCLVSIIINEDAYWKADTGHTGVRIRCGEYDTIFGFYPKGGSLKEELKFVAGATEKGEAVDYTSRDDLRTDMVHAYYPKKRRREYWFSWACESCETLRQRWVRLKAYPREFALYDNNCTTTAVATMNVAGAGPGRQLDAFAGWDNPTLPSPALLSEILEANGMSPVVHEPGVPLFPKDH